jgi:hypothetical protein
VRPTERGLWELQLATIIGGGAFLLICGTHKAHGDEPGNEADGPVWSWTSFSHNFFETSRGGFWWLNYMRRRQWFVHGVAVWVCLASLTPKRMLWDNVPTQAV